MQNRQMQRIMFGSTERSSKRGDLSGFKSSWQSYMNYALFFSTGFAWLVFRLGHGTKLLKLECTAWGGTRLRSL